MDKLLQRRRVGLAQIHIAVLLAGGAGLFAKLVPVGAADLTAGRTVFGSLALLLFAAVTRQSLRLNSMNDILALAVSGGLLAFHWFAFFHAIQVSTVAVGLLAFSSFPLFTTFLEPFLFGARIHARDILTAFLVTSGLVLVVPGFDVTNNLTQGVLWGLLSALSYALLSLLTRSYVSRYPASSVSFYQQAFAATCILPFAFDGTAAFSAANWAYLIILGVVFTGLGQSLVVASLRHLRAQTISIVFALEPVYGIALAWLLIGESPGLQTIVGGLLICAAVLLTSLGRTSVRGMETM